MKELLYETIKQIKDLAPKESVMHQTCIWLIDNKFGSFSQERNKKENIDQLTLNRVRNTFLNKKTNNSEVKKLVSSFFKEKGKVKEVKRKKKDRYTDFFLLYDTGCVRYIRRKKSYCFFDRVYYPGENLYPSFFSVFNKVENKSILLKNSDYVICRYTSETDTKVYYDINKPNIGWIKIRTIFSPINDGTKIYLINKTYGEKPQGNKQEGGIYPPNAYKTWSGWDGFYGCEVKQITPLKYKRTIFKDGEFKSTAEMHPDSIFTNYGSGMFDKFYWFPRVRMLPIEVATFFQKG